jgi:hypothetical protein
MLSYRNPNTSHILSTPPDCHVEWLYLVDGKQVQSNNLNIHLVGSTYQSYSDIAPRSTVKEVISVDIPVSDIEPELDSVETPTGPAGISHPTVVH